MTPKREDELFALGCPIFGLAFVAFGFLAVLVSAKYAIGSLAVCACWLQIGTWHSRREAKRYRQLFDEVFEPTKSGPTLKLNSQYGYPAFTVLFATPDEMAKQERVVQINAFKTQIQKLCGHIGSDSRPFDAAIAVDVSYDGYIDEMVAKIRAFICRRLGSRISNSGVGTRKVRGQKRGWELGKSEVRSLISYQELACLSLRVAISHQELTSPSLRGLSSHQEVRCRSLRGVTSRRELTCRSLQVPTSHQELTSPSLRGISSHWELPFPSLLGAISHQELRVHSGLESPPVLGCRLLGPL
jgi:hypothetical protein